MYRKLRNYEYFTIQGWMINKLKLTGVDLILYALIYSYAQDGTVLEWGYVDDFRSWFSAFGYDFECADIDYYMNNLRVKGYINVTKKGCSIVRHIKELED